MASDCMNQVQVITLPKSQMDGVQRASGLVNPWIFWENNSERAWKLYTLCISFIWLFMSYILLFLKNGILLRKMFLSFVSHHRKLINPRRSLEPLVYSLQVRNTGDNLDFQLASEVEDCLIGLNTKPWDLIFLLGRQYQN